MLSIIDDMIMNNNYHYGSYIDNMINNFNIMSRRIDDIFEERMKEIFYEDNNVDEDKKDDNKDEKKDESKDDSKEEVKDEDNNYYRSETKYYSYIRNHPNEEPIQHYYHKKDISENGEHKIIEKKQIGNKSITQQIIKDKEGKTNKKEYYNNINENNLEDINNFNKEWEDCFKYQRRRIISGDENETKQLE